MNKYLCGALLCIALLCGIIAGVHPVIAQPATCQNCQSQTYNYFGCDTQSGKTTTICTDNPLAQPNFRPWKKCLPIKIFMSFPTTKLKFNNLSYEQNGQEIEIFDQQSALRIAEEVLREWTGMCEVLPDPRCTSCIIFIEWITDPEKYRGDLKTGLAKTYQVARLTGECEPDCARSLIQINATPDFIKQDSITNLPRVFYYTNRTIASTYKDSSYDFRSLIQHEIGHWLGLHHSVVCNTPADRIRGIMDADGFGLFSPGRDYSMNFHDSCMFMKLYCCPALTDVAEQNTSQAQYVGEIMVYPTPAAQSIEYILPRHYLHRLLRVGLYTMLGVEVYSTEFIATSPQQHLQMSLPSGRYYLRVLTEHGEQSRGVIILER